MQITKTKMQGPPECRTLYDHVGAHPGSWPCMRVRSVFLVEFLKINFVMNLFIHKILFILTFTKPLFIIICSIYHHFIINVLFKLCPLQIVHNFI